MSWTYEWVPVYLHALYIQDGFWDSWVSVPFYVFGGIATVIFLIFAIMHITGSSEAKDEDARWTGVAYTGFLALLWTWPFIGIALAYSGPLTVIGFLGWCWYKMIPSKATRIAKRKLRRDELAAEVAGKLVEVNRGSR